MYKGRSLSDLATELERRAEAARDFKADTRSLTIETSAIETAPKTRKTKAQRTATSRISFDALGDRMTFGVNDYAHEQIAARLQIPRPFYKRMLTDHPDVFDRDIETLWQREPEVRMLRTLDDRVRAFVSDGYRPIDNVLIASGALPVLAEQQQMQIESAEVTDRKLYIKALFLDRQQTITTVRNEKRPVAAGLVISNSEVGAGSVNVEQMVFDLVCTNGMIGESIFRRHHVGKKGGNGLDHDEAHEWLRDETVQAGDNALMMRLQDIIRGSMDQSKFSGLVEQMQGATTQMIEGDPAKVVEVAVKKLDMREGERVGVLRHLIEGGDLSRYGLLQAVTRTSQDSDNYERATFLEKAGHKVLTLPNREWSNISQAS